MESNRKIRTEKGPAWHAVQTLYGVGHMRINSMHELKPGHSGLRNYMR